MTKPPLILQLSSSMQNVFPGLRLLASFCCFSTFSRIWRDLRVPSQCLEASRQFSTEPRGHIGATMHIPPPKSRRRLLSQGDFLEVAEQSAFWPKISLKKAKITEIRQFDTIFRTRCSRPCEVCKRRPCLFHCKCTRRTEFYTFGRCRWSGARHVSFPRSCTSIRIVSGRWRWTVGQNDERLGKFNIG